MTIRTAPAVLDIVASHLRANGYEGLVSACGECGCELGDLAPCDGMKVDCEAAHKAHFPDRRCGGWACDGECPWHMVPGPKPEGPSS